MTTPQAGRLVVANTLKAQAGRGWSHDAEATYVVGTLIAPGTGTGTGGTVGIASDIGVRRLTPTECERLQGFPDGWTQLGDTPDSRRYSALGDAVTVNVSEWIGRRLPA